VDEGGALPVHDGHSEGLKGKPVPDTRDEHAVDAVSLLVPLDQELPDVLLVPAVYSLDDGTPVRTPGEPSRFRSR
jgi:hypothetical protein